ncbi:MAG: MFS transporter, partial [Bacteroides sp.]
YFLIGCAWSAVLAMPFTILTNSVSGKNMGAYLGLFNGTICIPQILAAVIGGGLLHLVGGQQVHMLTLAGVLLLAGALCVYFIRETVAHTKP